MSDFYSKISAPMMTPKEEIDLIRLYQLDGNRRAIDRIIRSYMRMIIGMSKKYRHREVDGDDLIQAGCMGLIDATARFDLSRGLRLNTYARHYIKLYMIRHTQLSISAVRRPAQRGKFEYPAADKSLQTPVSDDSDDDLQDLLVCERKNPEEALASRQSSALITEVISTAIDSAHPRVAQIICDRHLGDQKRTLEEVGNDLGVSRERIRQIEKVWIDRMRKSISRKVLEVFE